MAELTPQLVAAALADGGDAVEVLVAALTPVIHARIARALLRRRHLARGRDVRQELEDISQEVFVELFRAGGKQLRAWDPQRGMGLRGFVGLVAEQRVAAILRSRRRSPWTEDPTLSDALDDQVVSGPDPEARLASRQRLEELLDLARAELSALGLQLLQRLVIEQRPIPEVSAELGMSRDALYTWKRRLKLLLQRLAAELDARDAAATPMKKAGP